MAAGPVLRVRSLQAAAEQGQGFAGPALEGDIRSPLAPPDGCRFHARRPHMQALRVAEEPQMREVRLGQCPACHFPLDAAETSSAPARESGREPDDPAADAPTPV